MLIFNLSVFDMIVLLNCKRKRTSTFSDITTEQKDHHKKLAQFWSVTRIKIDGFHNHSCVVALEWGLNEDNFVFQCTKHSLNMLHFYFKELQSNSQDRNTMGQGSLRCNVPSCKKWNYSSPSQTQKNCLEFPIIEKL